MKDRNSIWKEIVGWYGVIAILLAYVLSTFMVIQANSLGHQLLNLTGSIGIIVSAISKKDYQPVVLNVVWGLVALISLLTLFR